MRAYSGNGLRRFSSLVRSKTSIMLPRSGQGGARGEVRRGRTPGMGTRPRARSAPGKGATWASGDTHAAELVTELHVTLNYHLYSIGLLLSEGQYNGVFLARKCSMKLPVTPVE